MNKRTKIAAVLLSMATCGVSVSASGIYDVNYDLATHNVTISGKTSSAFEDVTMELLKIGKKGTDLKDINPSSADTVVLRYDQCETNKDGEFSFVFKLPSEVVTGNYVTRVSWGGKNEESQLIYISKTDFDNALLAINGATNRDEMITALDNGVDYFGFNNPYYSKMSGANKNFLADTVLNEKPNGGYTGSTDFGQVFIPTSAMCSLMSAQDGNTALSMIEFFDAELGFSGLTAYKTFDKQKDEVKKEIALAVAKSDAKSKAEIQAAFEDKVVIYSLYRVSGYDGVYTILYDNNHLMQIDFSDYNSISTQSDVLKKMSSKLFTSAADAAKAFDEYVLAEKKGTSHGGSSGGSSGNSMTYTPIIDSSNNTNNTTSFNDLGNVEWAREAIESLASKQIVSGKGNNEYDPDSAVKREEFVAMLVRALNLSKIGTDCNFDDVPSESWYFESVASAVNAGIVNGLSESTFGAGQNISKEDIVSLLYRAAVLKGADLNTNNYSGFDDENEIAGYALESVKMLSGAGIINGNGAGKFEPKKSATRAETAVMLYRFLNLFN